LIALTEMSALDSEKHLRDENARSFPTGEGSG
jgi:hypothetical protein